MGLCNVEGNGGGNIKTEVYSPWDDRGYQTSFSGFEIGALYSITLVRGTPQSPIAIESGFDAVFNSNEATSNGLTSTYVGHATNSTIKTKVPSILHVVKFS